MKPPRSPVQKRFFQHRGFQLAAALVAATLAIYAQVWRFEFIAFDDPVYVSENPRVLEGVSSENFRWCFGFHQDGNWIPLTWLSLMVDSRLFGRFAGGYHFTNALVHAVNTVLVFALFAKATGKPERSAFVAALFALHPLHVESVAWISERKDVLSIGFGLAALLEYVRYVQTGRTRALAICFLLFAASLLSKSTLVTLPFVMLLLDFWPLGRLTFDSRFKAGILVEKLPFVAASIGVAIVTLLAQRHVEAVRPLAVYPLSTRCMNAAIAYVDYLVQTLIPRHLAFFYAYHADKVTVSAAILAILVLLGVTAAAVLCWRRVPYFLFGWFWYLGTLVPMIGIVQVGNQQRADRYTYFPLIGIFVAFTWLAGAAAARVGVRRTVLSFAGLALLAMLAVADAYQVSVWHDSVRLTRHALAAGEDSAVARITLANGLLARGDTAEGMDLLKSTVETWPTDPEARFNLGVALEAVGRRTEAAQEYEAALAIDDGDPSAHNNLGAIRWKEGQFDEARRHFLRAIAIDPDHVRAYINLGSLDAEAGNYVEAIAASRRALQLDPTLLRCHHNIAVALFGQGHIAEGIQELRDILAVAPDDVEAQKKLKMVLDIQRQGSRR